MSSSPAPSDRDAHVAAQTRERALGAVRRAEEAGITFRDQPMVDPWTRLMAAVASLGNAWAEFKLALDAYRETK